MLIKAGVDISKLNREIRRALQIISHLFGLLSQELVITSTYEGNHSAGSLHYANDAVNIRSPDKPPLVKIDDLRFSLGPDFDVVYEVDHIHIEYDPK